LREYLYSLATDKKRGFIAGVLKFFLTILSFVYGLLIRILIVFKQHNPVRLSCKFISVGNITLGGTGKTTVVEYIARFLKEKGHKVAILTRGYKRSVKRKAQSEKLQYETMGDEAYMLAEKLSDIPVIVDADRIRAAKRAIQDYSVDTLILDDGFQQWHIKKDLEIVTIDAQNPFGNKRLIPRGILREPLANLRRADIFILTKTNFSPDKETLKLFLKSLNPAARIFESRHEPVSFFDFNHPQESIDLAALRGKSVVLFCGIGDPDSFTALISSLDINISTFFKFPDHYNYTAQDIDHITQTAKEKNVDTIITTEKDMVRVFAVRGTPYTVRFLALRIKLEIKDEQEFHNRLLGLSSR
jgi:tetraacyldisaccharide 4'-kinase